MLVPFEKDVLHSRPSLHGSGSLGVHFEVKGVNSNLQKSCNHSMQDVVLVEPHLEFPPADLLIQDEKGLRGRLSRSSPFDSVTSADRLSPVKNDIGSDEASNGYVHLPACPVGQFCLPLESC